MKYSVVPFTASIVRGQGSDVAAKQLEELVNNQASQGWEYVRLETVSTMVTTPATPGNAGCLGFGATPGMPASYDQTHIYMVVFRRP